MLKIISKIHKDDPAYYCELKIDTQKNRAEVMKAKEKEWNKFDFSILPWKK